MKIPVYKSMDVNECCGCELCEKVCPFSAISMKESNEGFLYPELDESKCKDCEYCIKKCPVLSEITRKGERITFDRKYFAGYALDNQLVNNSSSGGMWSLLVSEFLTENPDGVFFASKWADDFKKVVYARGNRLSDIDVFRRSKYAQSYKGNVYGEVKELLEEKKAVLFTGTPCEVAALYHFLDRDYSKLITVDLICQGPESPKALRDYMSRLEKKYKSKIVSVSLREVGGSSWIPQWMRIRFENGKEFFRPFYDTELGESLHTMQRLSCYKCKFAGDGHKADITIGDFHGADSKETYYNPRGTSIVVANNKKGLEFFQKAVGNKAILVEMERSQLAKTNPRLDETWTESPKRAEYASAFVKGNVFTAAWHVWSKKQNLLFRVHPKLRKLIEHIIS